MPVRDGEPNFVLSINVLAGKRLISTVSYADIALHGDVPGVLFARQRYCIISDYNLNHC